jgi:non-heme Fe2+,alpha-ketoglutarate-dependent halogenase
MPKHLSRQQVEQYHEQGFLAPVDVLSEDEAGNYLRRLQAVEAAYPDELSAENRNNPHMRSSSSMILCTIR